MERREVLRMLPLRRVTVTEQVSRARMAKVPPLRRVTVTELMSRARMAKVPLLQRGTRRRVPPGMPLQTVRGARGLVLPQTAIPQQVQTETEKSYCLRM
ncbi:MAG: hypothetical protein JNG86_18440 [Verrucomicrobiaceae bacterium]|nr:hypothetical protein [Verrucomicrobiaceae bacterium]